MSIVKGYYQCFVDGEWIDSSSGERIDVRNPANGELFAQVPSCSKDDAQRALESSARAQKEWQALPPVERAKYLLALCEKLEEEKDHFARLLVMEQGKTLAEAEYEVDDTIRYIQYNAEAGRRIEGQIFPTDAPREQLWIHKVPYGVTVGLCAFNYPLALIGRKIGPALITGNTMVLKPHELTPVSACEFCRLVKEVGLPKGVINMVIGTGLEIGATLVESPITKLVTVTGSIRAGQAICASAAENVTALSLELGGKAPFIVLEDADIDEAVEAAVVARYANCGQVCICNEMVLVHEAVADEFTEKVIARASQIKVGDPMKNIGMGASTSPGGLKRIEDIVNETVKQGAKVALGGKRPEGPEFEKGNWYLPTILTDVTKDMAAVQEEIFGPVMPIVRISGYEEALEIANARNDGLSAYLWTKNYSTFMDAIQRMETGTIFINKGICGYIQGYHSGHKRSGLGGEDGIYGLEGYLQKRTIYLKY
ncbi:aldehyde dehydrogenase family protein [Pelagicoccus sp. SDUM812003]|uniref:aldehyde dehydrogenase family protein n=1 Tax=Pelagicoccus sp. SDUM812003 TaxID=3041267 RepID=UPI00280E3F56|nr:aldehyde dehydrogenase family protein [Pelagicoccus sp. SDUM812003]MDQ8201415.1 aldehyde dehydrogenase family protein [Pelagicoccus sp. SDUM812003]